MTNKKSFWKNHIATWKNSGVSQAEYCRKYGLSYKTFGDPAIDLRTHS